MKRTLLEKIMIWVLVAAMLVTNVDLTAFTAMAEELIIDENDPADMQSLEASDDGSQEEPVVEITDVQSVEDAAQPEEMPAEEIPVEDAAPPQETPAEGEEAQPQSEPAEEIPVGDAAPPQETPVEDIVQPQETPVEDVVSPEEPPAESDTSEPAADAMQPFDTGLSIESIREVEPGAELPVGEEMIEAELSAAAIDSRIMRASMYPVWYGYMEYEINEFTKYRINVTYKHGGTDHSDRNYVWIYGSEALEGQTDEKRIAYCIEPGVSSTNGDSYTEHRQSLEELDRFKNNPDQAKRIMAYAYFGIEYPGHWDDNQVGVEYFAAAQSLIWEEVGVDQISWKLQDTGKTIDTQVAQRKAEIKGLVDDFYAEPVFESTTLYQDKSDPNKTYTIKLAANSPSLNSWTLNTNKLPKGVKNPQKLDREIQFQLDPNVDVREVKFEITKKPSYRHDMLYYTAPWQQTVIVIGTLPTLAVECPATVIPVSRVQIKKEDDTGKPVEGVTFKYGTSKTNLNQMTKATDANGLTEIRLENAGVNTIYVQEHEVPSHLVKSDEIKAVTFKTGGIGTVTFVNDRVRRSVSLKKVDAFTGDPLAGVVFRYWEKGRLETMSMAVTDEEGSFTSGAKFLPGAYVVMEEVAAPSGYSLPKPPHNQKELRISMDASKNVFEFENSPKNAELVIEKYNDRTGDPIKDGVGCKFKVSTSLTSGANWKTVEIGPDGTASLGVYPHGKVVFFQEIEAPEGYKLNSKMRWAIIDATNTTENKIAINKVRVPNEELTVKLRIKKKGSDGLPLQGVRFRLEQWNGESWYTVASNLVTGPDGKVDIPGTYNKTLIIHGELQLVEEETIPGYKLLDGPILLDEKYIQTESPVIEIEQTNEKIPTRFWVYKFDSYTRKPLAGAVFEITDEEGNLLQTLMTNSEGVAETTELLADVTYYIEEIEAPRGYLKVEGRHPFVISTEEPQNPAGEYFLKREVPNQLCKGKIKIEKVNQDEKPLPGIEFTIYKGTQVVARLTTDQEGKAESDWLDADSEYRIRETYTPPEFEKKDLLDYTFDFMDVESQSVGKNWKVDVTRHEVGYEITASFEVTNTEHLGQVTVRKVDKEKPEVVVAGATFELYNRYNKEKPIATRTTDEKGIAVFQDLPIVNPIVDPQQGHYYLKETTPGENHILPENTGMYFSLTADDLDYELTFPNPPVKGSVEILKVDEDNPEKTLEGAEFAIYDADNPNTALKTVVTGKDGIARFDDLRYGEYVIKEIKAPLYYRNDPVHGGNEEYWDKNVGGYRVTIDENGEVILLEISNPKLQVKIKVVKYSEQKQYRLGRAEFALYNSKGEFLEKIVTEPIYGDPLDDGTGVSKTYYAEDLGEGAYIIETKAPAGYELNPEKHYIQFEQNSEKTVVEILKEIENTRSPVNFKLQKVDEDGNGVGATFALDVLNRDTRKYWSDYPGNVFPFILTTTKENPVVDLSKFVAQFDYMLRLHDENKEWHSYVIEFEELYADQGYQPIEGVFASVDYYFGNEGWVFSASSNPEKGVTYDEDTMILTVVNKNIPVRLNVKKTDNNGTGKYLAGAVFRITPDGQEEKAVEVTSTADSAGVTVELPYAKQYVIEEIAAPPGYFKSRETVTVKASELKLDNTEAIWFYHGSVSIDNHAQPEFVIRKTGSDQKPLKATFRITEIENTSGLNQEIIVSTQESDGMVRVDLTPFSEFMNVSGGEGILKIKEIAVEDADYQMLAQPVYVKWSTQHTKWTFDTEVEDYKNPENVSFNKEENFILITVPNKKKNYSYQIMKQGAPDDTDIVWADVIISDSLTGKSENMTITSESPEDISAFFNSLTNPEGHWIQIEEKDTTPGYEKVPVMGFWYYPNEKGLDKFDGANGPVSFEFDEPDGERIIIKLTNARSQMRLPLKKTNSEGKVIAGAKFRITTQNPSFMKEYVTTGNPEGEIFEFPYAQQILLEEIEAPPGYEMGEKSVWELTAKDFTAIDDRTNSVYECNKFLTDPIVNENQYDLRIKKTDEGGQPVNATFTVVSSTGRSWSISTQDGSASLNTAVGNLVKDAPPFDKTGVLKVMEVSADEGLQLREGVLAEIVVYLDPIRGKTTGSYFELREYDERFIDVEFTDTELEFTVKNEFIPVNLTLIKKEEGKEDTYLAGAEFTITVHGGTFDGTQEIIETTGTPTGTTIDLPWAESYSIQETKAPEGYILDPTIHTYTLDDFENEYGSDGKTLTAKRLSETYGNQPIKGSIQLRKVDSESGELLAGAVFEIRKGEPPQSYEEEDLGSYKLAGEITIGDDGIGAYRDLPYGKYFLREIKAPEGYQRSKELIPFVIERAMQTVELDVPNRKLEGSLTIRKVDSENNQKPLAGAVFTIHREDTNKQVGDELVTNAKGEAGPVSLPYGEYYIKEVRFPAGYVSATGKEYPFELNQEISVHSETIKNTTAKYGLRIYKRDAATRDLLAGAVFGVFEDGMTPENGDPIVTVRSNASGIATVLLSEPNEYDVYELTPPPGYERLTQKFDVSVTDTIPTVELWIDNDRQKLSIEIHKQEAGTEKPLAGAVFEIRNERTGALVATTDPTETDGKVAVEVPAGDHTYTVTEIQAPEGYVLDSTPHKVTITRGEDEEGNVTYEAEPLVIDNRLIQGNIKLVKVDAANQQKPLAGAVFEVRNESDEVVGELTTNSQGEAMTKELPHGTYTLVETKAPDGYELSQEPYTAVLSEKQTLVVITADNTLKKGGFSIKKIDAQKPEKTLSGAEFTVFKTYEDARNLKNAIAKQLTGEEGLADFTNLDYGTYYVRETEAPEGYQLNDRIMAVTVGEDWQEAQPLVAEDYEQPQEGYFRVVKRDEATGSALAGAVFRVTGPDDYSKDYTTDATGSFRSDPLKPGTYTVTEIESPEGYYLSKEEKRTKIVEVKAGAGTLEEAVELVFENEQILLPIHIKKTDGDTQDPKPLVGAEFKIYRLDETAEGGKTEVETLVTDMHGEADSRLLPAGSYEVVETQPPKGYELAADPSKEFTIDENSTSETLTFAFVNEIKKGTLKVHKVDKNDPQKSLPGAVFEAYGIESGVYYREKTGENGYAVFKNLPYGIYRIREIEAPEGYELNSGFEEYVMVGEKSPEGGTEITLEVPNTPLEGEIQLTKTDAETNELLDGAVYGIYTKLLKNGDVDPDSHMEGYDMVTKAPHVTSKKLPYGTYYVKEITPPKGYKVNDTVYTVTFRENIPLVAINAEDEAYKGSIEVIKQDSATGKPLAGVIFAIFTDEEYQKYQQGGGGDLEAFSAIYLTTDEDGEASTGEVLELDQKYVMVEYAPLAGYDPQTEEDGSEKVWRFTPTMEKLTIRYEIKNTKRSEIIIHKTDEKGNPVNGVEFGLYSYGSDGKPETDDDLPIDTFTTAIDGSGTARYETDQLLNGWYYVKELSCGSIGYELSKEIVPIEITDDKREYEFDFVNYRARAEVAIQKRDEFGRPLAGAKFGLYRFTSDWQEKTDFEEDLIEEFKLDQNGYGKIENLICDLYVIREIEAPPGYRPMEPIFVDLLDVGGEIPSDPPEAEQQEDDPAGDTPADAQQNPPAHITAGEKNGRTYYYYYRDLYNEPFTGWIEIQKKAVSEEGTPIEGLDLSNARFEITDENDKVADTVTTDESGKARSRELPLGTYTIREIQAPDGTQLNEKPGKVTIDGRNESDIYTYTHQNTVVMGQLKIRKVDPEGKLLEGAEFDVYAEDAPEGADSKPVAQLITGPDGIATSGLLPYGWYIIRETKAPDGYTFDPNLRLRCRVSENEQIVELTVLNYQADEPGVPSIYIVKYDKDDPNHYLADAQFEIYEDDALTERIGGPYTTDERGLIKITNDAGLTEGETYYLKETIAPEGYQLDETVHSFVWGETTTIALYIPNEKEKGYIRFEKTGEMLTEIKEDTSYPYPDLKKLVWKADQPLAGAQIGIYATGEVALDGKTYQKGDLIVRLESGETSPGLPLGIYEYQELFAPPSYILDSERHSIEVTNTTTEIEPALATLENTHASVSLQLYKKFSDDEDAPDKLCQVRFGVYTAKTITSGEVQIEPDTLVGVLEVDETGVAEADLKLPQGAYYVKELETAEGYLLDDTRYPFQAVYNNKNEEIIISSQEDPIVNEPVYGVIRLKKTGELFTQVEVSIEDNKYQVNRPVFTQGELNGAKVEIRATQEITIDGKTYQKGDIVDTLISGEKPESRKLPVGTYTAVEVEAPEGYVLDPEPKVVEIKPFEAGSHEPAVELLAFANTKKMVDLRLYKSFFGLEAQEAKKLYSEVLFGVYAAEDIRGAADGVVLKKDTLVELIRIEEDGSGGIEKGLLPAGNYYVKELETAEDYQIDETHYPFTVSFVKDDTETGEDDTPSDTITVEVAGVDEEHPIVNLPDDAKIPFAFRKVGEENDPLAGAQFRLYYCKEKAENHTHSELAGSAGSCWKEIEGLSPKTSGTDGVVDFGLLPDGTYQLRETKAPEGYVLPAGQWRITIDSSETAAEHIIITAAGDAQPPAFEKAEGNDVYQYQVSNRKVRDLPFTGGVGVFGYLGGGSALLAASGFLRKRKKKDKKNRKE